MTVIAQLRRVVLAVLTMSLGSSCVSSSGRLEPSVVVNWDGRVVNVTINNPHERPVLVEDASFQEEWRVPAGVFVRVSNSTGTILENQAADPESWWTPWFVESSVSEPRRLLELAASGQIRSSLRLQQLVAGMRTSEPPTSGECSFQVRVTIRHSSGRVPLTRTSEWVHIPCAQLFPG